MGRYGTLCRISDRQLARITAAPDRAASLRPLLSRAGPVRSKPRRILRLDKAWDALDKGLTLERKGGPSRRNPRSLSRDSHSATMARVVTSELTPGRDTLRFRLMGAGACLRDAPAELAALPEDARERALAKPVLLRCYIDIPRARRDELGRPVRRNRARLARRLTTNRRNEGGASPSPET